MRPATPRRPASAIVGLEGARQRQRRLAAIAAEVEGHGEAFRCWLELAQHQVAAAPAVGHDAQAARPRNLFQFQVGRVVGIEHGGAFALHQLGEEAALGVEIAVHLAVVVEMVARQVGECGGGDAHAVEAKLIEAVARGFHRQALDAVLGQRRQAGVQLDRVRRGQRGGRCLVVRDQPECAQAGGLEAGVPPNLAGEIGHRCLAVGAGHGGDQLGLGVVEARGQDRQATARIVVFHQGDRVAVGLEGGPFGGEDHDGALGYGLVDEFAAVALGAGQSRKEIAGADLTAVRREPRHLDRFRQGHHRHLVVRLPR
jgi:hypothetical protein